MAKSIRSKWKRKCRAVKRERYGKKELELLKKTLGIDDKQGSSKPDPAMSEIKDIVTVTTAAEIKEKEKQTENNDDMETDEVTKRLNPKKLRDKNGAYPLWLHPRKIKKNKGKKGKKSKSKKK